MTPISATGNSPPAPHTKGSAQAGFSVAETLIVLALIGLAARAVMLVIPNDGRALRQEVETFAARVKAAQDVAIFRNGQVFGVVDAFGYRFEERRDGVFKPVELEVLQPARWSSDTQVLLESGGRARIALGGLGTLSPLSMQFARGDAQLSLTLDFDGTIEIARE